MKTVAICLILLSAILCVAFYKSALTPIIPKLINQGFSEDLSVEEIEEVKKKNISEAIDFEAAAKSFTIYRLASITWLSGIMILVGLTGFSTRFTANKIFAGLGCFLCWAGLVVLLNGWSNLIMSFGSLTTPGGPEGLVHLISALNPRPLIGGIALLLGSLFLIFSIFINTKLNASGPVKAHRKILCAVTLISGVITVGFGVLSIITYQQLNNYDDPDVVGLAKRVSNFLISNSTMTLSMIILTPLTLICLLITPSRKHLEWHSD